MYETKLPPTGPKTFDVLASINMFRYDLENTGFILEETYQRSRDEELSYIAEGMNRPVATEFTLRNIGGKLSYFDKGEWRPYIGTLTLGLRTAEKEAFEDSRKFFKVERAARDLQLGYAFEAMQPGDTLHWDSAYPEKEEGLYGADFVLNQGFMPGRKMGFLYKAVKNPDGSLTLFSQSVDNSDEDAFRAAHELADGDPTASIKDMREAYDQVLQAKDPMGEEYFAGRKLSDWGSIENAWEAVLKHPDLINYFLINIEALAKNYSLTGEQLEKEKKMLTYGVWAALRQRIENDSLAITTGTNNLAIEVHQAFVKLSAMREYLIGCGGIFSGETILDDRPEEVFKLTFESKWDWKKGICRINNCPTRPTQTEVGPCEVCRTCQRWFDKGKDPAKMYKGAEMLVGNSVTTEISTRHRQTDIKKEKHDD